MTAALAPLTADRWVPFKDTFEFLGLDLTGATFAMQIRLYPDAPGAAILSLIGAAAGSEGLSVAVSTVDGLPVSVVTVQINETTIEGILPFAVSGGAPNRKAGSDVVLAYDLVLSATGIPKQRACEGAFTIRAGVTV